MTSKNYTFPTSIVIVVIATMNSFNIQTKCLPRLDNLGHYLLVVKFSHSIVVVRSKRCQLKVLTALPILIYTVAVA